MDIRDQVVALAECMNVGADRPAGLFEFPLPIYFGRALVVADTPKALKAILHRSRAVLRVNGCRQFRLELASTNQQTTGRFRAQVDWICETQTGQQVSFRTVLFCRGLPDKAVVEAAEVEGARQWHKVLRPRLN